jgi:hypothetical protein
MELHDHAKDSEIVAVIVAAILSHTISLTRARQPPKYAYDLRVDDLLFRRHGRHPISSAMRRPTQPHHRAMPAISLMMSHQIHAFTT